MVIQAIKSNDIKYSISCIALLFVLPVYCFANSDTQKALSKAKKKSKIIVLKEAARSAIDSGLYSNAINFIEKAEELNSKHNDQNITGELYFLYGEVYYYKDENDKAIKYYKKSSKLGKVNGNRRLYCKSLYKTGLTFYYKGDYDSSMVYISRARDIAEEFDIKSYIGKAYEAKARVTRELNRPIEALLLIDSAINVYKEINDSEGLANSYNNAGWIYFNTNEFQKAISSYSSSIEYRKQNNDYEGIAIAYVNIGNVYWRLGDFEKAIEFQQNALRRFESIGHKQGIANSLNNIGICYENLITEDQPEENIKNLQSALGFYEKALEYRKELLDSFEISNSFMNIGNIKTRIINEEFISKYGSNWNDSVLVKYSSDSLLEEYGEARQLYITSLRIKQKINDINGIGSIYHNLGKINTRTGNYSESFRYFNLALDCCLKTQNKYLEANVLRDIGEIYFILKQYNKAKDFYSRSLKISKSNNFRYIIRYNYLSLSELYEKVGQIPLAFSYYKQFTQIKDSIVNEEKYKQIAELETKYETEKKEKEIEILNKDNEIQKNRVRQARIIILFISFGGAIVIFFLIIVFKQFRDKKKANIKLEEQNKLITKQKEDITDSITYASRIQSALLPQEETLDNLLIDYFLLFLPKDIVSGDFYWVTEYKGRIITVAADCTGHGVPGAFMSVLGTAFLNEIVNKHKELNASEILDELRKYIIKALKQSVDSPTGKDGMDMALTIIDRNKLTAEYSGAYNPLIVCRGDELIEYKADKMPVGIHVKYEVPFKNNQIKLEKGDVLYTFSDGFQDQFGGKDRRKFMIKKMKQLLLEIHEKPLGEQKKILETTYYNWKGNISQLDDVIILGLRV